MKYGHLELHIEELLKEKGISKNTICKELDIPRSNFNRYCRNEFQRLDAQLMSQALHTAYESNFWKVSFSMNETVTKRFLLYFRLMMVVWILIANAFFHAIEFEYSWLVFLSNIMLFTMEGDIKDRFISVELGGLVGMVLTVLAMLAISALTPVLGGMLGLLLPLGVVLFILIILHPYAPKVLNNVGFAYLTVACIDSAAFAANLPLFFGVYIVGSLVFNGGCVLLMKPARYLAARSIKNDVKADA